MHPITRRDFLNGFALAVPMTASATPSEPAERTGLQGQTDAVLQAAHSHRDRPGDAAQAVVERDEEVEDLVVVGAGLSGLAGAWWFREHAGRSVRVLLLDALDDIGGHARRNEFVSRSGRRLIGYGGSQSLDAPSLFSAASHHLLNAVGVDLARFKNEFFDREWARRHGLTRKARWFGAAAWGSERLVLSEPGEGATDWVTRAPLNAAAQAGLTRLLGNPRHDVMPGVSRAVKRTRLGAMTYRDFLLRLWRVDASVVALLQQETMAYFGVGVDATSALDAWAAGLPGFQGLELGEAVDPRLSASARQLMVGQDEYVYHFPDGNAGVARALLRALRPDVLPGQGMESLVDARLDRAALDAPEADVRLRLGATVTALRHLGPPASAALAELRYVDAQGRHRAVRARQVLLACWHRVIARLTDEIPVAQRRALDDQVKTPLLYATVLVSNWQPWKRAGIRSIKAPGGFWADAELDFPVSMGNVKFPSSPDEPMLLHLAKVVVPGDGRSPREQAAAGRRQLMQWSFAHLESEVRGFLQGALAEFGFDAGRDIEAITINRWAHGYSLEYARPWDRFWPAGPLPCDAARRGWGRVAIANADSGAYAYAHSAIDQAARAVQELLPQARLPNWHRFPGPAPAALGFEG